MNKNIDLSKILKDCPKGTKLYSTIYGEVTFHHINETSICPIVLQVNDNTYPTVTNDGKFSPAYKGECILFPSKDQRDWSKFTATWLKKDRFDPKMLNKLDKVLGRDHDNNIWKFGLFSHIVEHDCYPYKCVTSAYMQCIPYNDETKYLVGTTNEAPEYYRYWED